MHAVVSVPIPRLQTGQVRWSPDTSLPSPRGMSADHSSSRAYLPDRRYDSKAGRLYSTITIFLPFLPSRLPSAVTETRALQLWREVEEQPCRSHRPFHRGPARSLGCVCHTSELTPMLPAVPGWLPFQGAGCWLGPDATLGLS